MEYRCEDEQHTVVRPKYYIRRTRTTHLKALFTQHYRITTERLEIQSIFDKSFIHSMYINLCKCVAIYIRLIKDVFTRRFDLLFTPSRLQPSPKISS